MNSQKANGTRRGYRETIFLYFFSPFLALFRFSPGVRPISNGAGTALVFWPNLYDQPQLKFFINHRFDLNETIEKRDQKKFEQQMNFVFFFLSRNKK